MAVKKKTKKKPKKTQKRGKRVRVPKIHKYTIAGCQTRGTACQKNPSLYRSTPKKPK